MSDRQSPSESIGRSGLSAATATVAALTSAMAAGQLSSVELTSYYLDQIAARDAELRAVISVSDDARQQAAAIDAARSNGAELGPLAGIPVLIKDNVSVAGAPATAGSPALLDAPAADAFLIGKLRAAGAIILGKANLSEWANFRSTHSSSGWSTLGGQASNPYGTGRSPSGSSSGSAVAVAAGLAALAIGSETDGSIISPANNCGIVGLKPTLGLVSRSGIVPISSAQDTAGPMTRTVADAAALLSVIAGFDPDDPVTQDTPDPAGRDLAVKPDYTSFLDQGALAGARIGIWREAGDPVPGALAILDRASALLTARGAELVDPVVLPGADQLGKPAFAALRMEFKDDLNAYLARLGGPQPKSLAELIAFNLRNEDRVLAVFGQEIFTAAQETGGRADPNWRLARDEARTLARNSLDSAFAGHGLDAVIALSGNPAWLTDHVLGDHVTFSSTSPAAVSGYPAITVPAGQVAGLPVGISFMGPAWSEPRLLALAHAFEVNAAADRSQQER